MIYLLHHTLQATAERLPDQPAFRFGNQALTFEEMVIKTNQLAHLLIESGVRRGDRVGVYLPRSLETAIAIYGIMQAGAVYVPLDPHVPAARTLFLLKDCNIRHLVTHPAQKRLFPELLTKDSKLHQVIGISGDWPVPCVSWESLQQLPSGNPSVRILEMDLAYIMYTSGSTGTPKGIMHTHYSGLNYAKLSANLFGLGEGDRIGSHAPLHFDISTMAYFTAPLVGATSIIISEAHTKLPASLTELMQNEELTVWYSVPLALTQMLSQGLLEKRDLSHLRWVLYGGESFPIKHLSALMNLWPHARFCNVYGPAEVNQCTYYHLPGPPKGERSVPLGQVWDNTEMLIIDESDQPVAPGTPGELLIRSITMMKGYWQQPELTKRSLYYRMRVPGHEEIFYRTGDLVILDEDNNLQFLGRKDRQVKTRGYRVELDEVEDRLLKIEAIMEAAVFSTSHESEGLLIEAAVILNKNARATEEDLRKCLIEQLPMYAVPRAIHVLESLPRTSTGKINRLQLQQHFSK